MPAAPQEDEVLALASSIFPHLPEVKFLGNVSGAQKASATDECIDQALDVAERIIMRNRTRFAARAGGIAPSTSVVSAALAAPRVQAAPLQAGVRPTPPGAKTAAEQLAIIMASHGVNPEQVKQAGGPEADRLAAIMAAAEPTPPAATTPPTNVHPPQNVSTPQP